MSTLALDYVALSCRDPGALESTLTGALQLERREVEVAERPLSVISLGHTNLVLLEAGDERLGPQARVGVHHIGLKCVDAADDPQAVATGLTAQTPLGDFRVIERGFGGEQIEFDAHACGGVRTRIGSALPGFAPSDSAVVERIDHLGVASADNRQAEAVFAGALGFAVESRQTDMETRTVIESFTSDRYGVKHHARTPEAVGGLRVSFVTVGDCELEFLEEFDTRAMSESRSLELGHTPGTTRQDQGAIGRFVERQGPGLHHLAIKTPDINAMLADLKADGVRIIDAVGRPGSRRALIGFIHPSMTGGILIHFVERTAL